MIFCVERSFLYTLILITFVDYKCKADKLKDSILSRTDDERHKRAIDGNDLPPLPITGSTGDDGVPLVYRVQEGGETVQQDRRQDYTGSGTRSYGYRYVSSNSQSGTQTVSTQTTTAAPSMVHVGSDPQIEFRSRIRTSGQTSGSRGSNPTDAARSGTGSGIPQETARTGTGSGYRYTSTVYSGPGSRSQTAYRYRPPYDQLPQGTRTQFTTGSQTRYSPYVGTGVSSNPSGSGVQYVGGGGRFPIYNRNERVYGGSSNYIPNRGVLSNDPTCPTDSTTVYINNMECTTAISTLGSFICYNYERVSRECCERCLSIKQAANTGCEYGDWSYQCRNMQPFDCYNDRNRDICCETCRIYRERQTQVIPGCEYLDLTPRCQIIREKRHLCYLPENQRLCCYTCPTLADPGKTVCKWGDQNPTLCRPFDQQGQLRINCYMPTVQQICCEACERLKSRVREQVPGCEYGDRPVSFNTPYGVLECANYISRFGVEVCNNLDVSTHCCYTCYRYRRQTQQGKK